MLMFWEVRVELVFLYEWFNLQPVYSNETDTESNNFAADAGFSSTKVSSGTVSCVWLWAEKMLSINTNADTKEKKN